MWLSDCQSKAQPVAYGARRPSAAATAFSATASAEAMPRGRRRRALSARSATVAAGFVLGLALLLVAPLSGCVTKAQADAQARAAFLAGQQQARMELQQNHGPTVKLIGAVKTPVIPWTPELTLANAILAAGYYGPADPAGIVIMRNGQTIPVDPKQLLNGHDVPLESGDAVQIK
jgi:hypothetical protein